MLSLKKERNIVAFHEAGHTVIGVVLDEADVVHKVTIVPRGQVWWICGNASERRSLLHDETRVT